MKAYSRIASNMVKVDYTSWMEEGMRACSRITSNIARAHYTFQEGADMRVLL